MGEHVQVGPKDIAALTNGSTNRFLSFIDDRDLTVADLYTLLEAEHAAQNRENVTQALQNQIAVERISQYVDMAQEDVNDIEQVLDRIEHIESADNLPDLDDTDVSMSELQQAVEGTVADLKSYVDNHCLSLEHVAYLLSAEQDGKNRKTAKRFLRKQIQQRQIEDDLNAAETALQELKQDIADIEDDILHEQSDDLQLPDVEQDSTSNTGTAGHDTTADTVTNSTEAEASSTESPVSNEQPRREELIQSLVENGLPEHELRESTLSDLEQLMASIHEQDRKAAAAEAEVDQYRESLIMDLQQSGLPENELRAASTHDLEQLKASVTQQPPEQERDSSQEDTADTSEQQSSRRREELVAALQERGYAEEKLRKMTIGELEQMMDQAKKTEQGADDDMQFFSKHIQI